MNRKIKFRAWDKRRELMAPLGSLESWFMAMMGSTLEPELVPLFMEDHIIMQYTGLKDSTKWEQLTEVEQKEWLNRGETKETWNGKEIYEGDIVKHPPGSLTKIGVVKHGFEQDWGQTGFIVESIDLMEDYLHKGKYHTSVDTLTLQRNGDYEVIGNIYSNPELLEAT